MILAACTYQGIMRRGVEEIENQKRKQVHGSVVIQRGLNPPPKHGPDIFIKKKQQATVIPANEEKCRNRIEEVGRTYRIDGIA